MKSEPGLWRRLKVGDRVRMVEIPSPSGTFRGWMTMHRDTQRAYRYLLNRKRPLVVTKVESGGPWVQFRVRAKNGRMEHHYMLLNHDGLRRVLSRDARSK